MDDKKAKATTRLIKYWLNKLYCSYTDDDVQEVLLKLLELESSNHKQYENKLKHIDTLVIDYLRTLRSPVTEKYPGSDLIIAIPEEPIDSDDLPCEEDMDIHDQIDLKDMIKGLCRDDRLIVQAYLSHGSVRVAALHLGMKRQTYADRFGRITSKLRQIHIGGSL